MREHSESGLLGAVDLRVLFLVSTSFSPAPLHFPMSCLEAAMDGTREGVNAAGGKLTLRSVPVVVTIYIAPWLALSLSLFSLSLQ